MSTCFFPATTEGTNAMLESAKEADSKNKYIVLASGSMISSGKANCIPWNSGINISGFHVTIEPKCIAQTLRGDTIAVIFEAGYPRLNAIMKELQTSKPNIKRITLWDPNKGLTEEVQESLDISQHNLRMNDSLLLRVQQLSVLIR